MMSRFMFGNHGHGQSLKARRKRAPRARRSSPIRTAMLGVEELESRLVLSINPVLTVVADQIADEGAPLNITNLGMFTDEVEGDGSGGATIGLDPMDFALLATSTGAFNPLMNVTFNTDLLTISDGFSGVGTTVSANAGFGSYSIAVFAFTDFDLGSGITITATGSRPLALLSLDEITVDGIIDVSAFAVEAGIQPAQLVPGPGGGAGGDGLLPRHGDPAAGAPTLAGGQLGSGTNTTGSGGGFGGVGGTGESNIGPGLSGAGGITYGDLSIAIQGGSGGSASAINNGTTVQNGGGGGGGIELGAVNLVTITGQVLANGGRGRDPSSSAISAS